MKTTWRKPWHERKRDPTPTVRLGEILRRVCRASGQGTGRPSSGGRRQVSVTVRLFLDEIVNELAAGHHVSVTGFGLFRRSRGNKARTGVRFRPGKRTRRLLAHTHAPPAGRGGGLEKT